MFPNWAHVITVNLRPISENKTTLRRGGWEGAVKIVSLTTFDLSEHTPLD